MILKQYSAPTKEPIHLSEAKIHLRAGGSVNEAAAVLYTAEDNLIGAAISSARIAAETYQWRALVLQTWDMYLDAFPGGNSIELPLPPLRAVEGVWYTDSSGATLEFTDYSVDLDSERGRVVLDYGYYWPTATLAPNNPVHIRFKCGYLVPFTIDGSTVTVSDTELFETGDRVRLSVSGGNLPAGLSEMTDFYFTATGLSLTSGGTVVTAAEDGSGTYFMGVLPSSTKVGMLLILSDLYEYRSDTIGIASRLSNVQLPRGASQWLTMDAVKRF